MGDRIARNVPEKSLEAASPAAVQCNRIVDRNNEERCARVHSVSEYNEAENAVDEPKEDCDDGNVLERHNRFGQRPKKDIRRGEKANKRRQSKHSDDTAPH